MWAGCEGGTGVRRVSRRCWRCYLLRRGYHLVNFVAGLRCGYCLTNFGSKLHDWIGSWFEAKSTDFVCGWWFLKVFEECLLIGGILDWIIWVSRGARANLFRIWNNCLRLLVFRLAREVLSGICDAGSTYFILLKLEFIFEALSRSGGIVIIMFVYLCCMCAN